MHMAWLIEVTKSDELIPHEVNGTEVSIGRNLDNAIAIPRDSRASRRHAIIARVDGAWYLQDCSSTNGTLVNGRRHTRAPLTSGDHIQIGSTAFTFSELKNPYHTVPDSRAGLPGMTQVQIVLSPQERRVVWFVGQGLTDDQIASKLGIAVSTVRSHLDRVKKKSGYRKRADLTRLALELGEPPS